jgi:L-threonylcarbamoyladenylate synthase
MKTELLSNKELERAAELLKQGEVVAFPTETVYGLGANALQEKAVAKIFKAKGRPSDNPLIVHIDSQEMLDTLVEDVPENATKLMKLWPGPLTLVFKKKEMVPSITSAGLKTVGIRMPSHPIFQKLIKLCGFPLAAPSANSFGKPSCTTHEHVLEDMDGKIAAIIKGSCDVGIESTIVDVSRDKPMLLRPGKITQEEVENCIGPIDVHPSVLHPNQKTKTALSPGMKYRHYSPSVPVVYVEQENLDTVLKSESGKKGLITSQLKTADIVCRYKTTEELMKNVFSYFRDLEKKVDIIIIDTIPKTEIALLNRIKKAASRIR